jgi:hypothetical protein
MTDHAAYAFGKVAKGYEALVMGDDALRHRVAAAWHEGLALADPRMMPTPELRALAERIAAFCTRGSGDTRRDALYAEHYGIAWASVYRRRYRTVRKVAEDIRDLYERLERYLDRSR